MMPPPLLAEMQAATMTSPSKKEITTVVHPDNLYEHTQACIKIQNEKFKLRFAPDNGVCWRCGVQIYHYITLERATNSLITGCPICHRSYVD